MKTEWIEIKCPKCGKVSNYTRTLSGTDKCDNPRCYKLLKVGQISKIDLDRMRHNS